MARKKTTELDVNTGSLEGTSSAPAKSKAPRKKAAPVAAPAPSPAETEQDIRSSANYSRIVKHLHKRADQPFEVSTPAPAAAAIIVTAPASPVAPKAPVAEAQPVRPSHEAIAKLAYSYYVARGYAPGDPAADWLRAEQELLRRGK